MATTTTTTTTDVTLPNPEATLRPGASGIPVEMGGDIWLLSDHAPASGKVWDDIYDAATLSGECDTLAIQTAAVMLLTTCHDLSLDEAVPLVKTADPRILASVVRTALFEPEKTHRTRSSWIRSASWRMA